jgi:hypothetical protein
MSNSVSPDLFHLSDEDIEFGIEVLPIPFHEFRNLG